MQLITIGTKNQIVIPKEARMKISGLKPGRKVAVVPVDSHTLMIKVDENQWLQTSYGAMKKTWKDRDVVGELEKQRNEWDEV